MKLTATIIVLLFLLSSIQQLSARPAFRWDAERLENAADTIVVAILVDVRDTGKVTTIGGLRNGDGSPISAIEMEATFEVRHCSKGKLKKLDAITLVYLRRAVEQEVYVNPARLVAFERGSKSVYKLYLKAEADGRYTPVPGQVDPADAVVIVK